MSKVFAIFELMFGYRMRLGMKTNGPVFSFSCISQFELMLENLGFFLIFSGKIGVLMYYLYFCNVL